MAGRVSYTVQRALTLPCLRAARVVAGREGVGRAVEAVAVLDVTDFEGVRPNQLVLSNAYPLLGLDLRMLVERLVAPGASALGLKLSDYWQEVPQELIEAADATSLPILVLPEGAFDEIVNPLLTAIAGHQLDTLRQSGAVHDKLTRAALREEGDPSSVAPILADALHRPAAIFTDRGEIVGATGESETWISDELIAYVIGGVSGGVVRVDGSDYYLASAPATGTPRVTVCVRDVDPGDALTRAAITHAAVVAGMLLVGRQQVEEVYRKYERELLEDLTEGRPVRPDDARSRASQIGWPLHRPYLVLVAGRVNGGGGLPPPDALPLTQRDLEVLAQILGDGALEGRVFLRPPGVGLVLHLGPRDDPITVADTLEASMAASTEAPWNEPTLVLGVGRPRLDVTALADAFREAKLAVRFHHHVHGSEAKVTHFADLGAIGLLSLARSPTRLLGAANKVLGPLADPTLPRRDDLMATLHTLLARNMNMRIAAEELFFHYNTVRHRASRLRTLLGGALDDPDRRLLLSMAVATAQLYESSSRNSDGS